MKKLFILLSAALLVSLAGCEEKVINTTNPLTEDPTATCEILNANVDALQAIVEAMESKIITTQCLSTSQGYSVSFSNNRSVSLYTQATNSNIPFVQVEQEDGVYYWYHNDKWVLDDNNNRVEVLKNKISFKIIDGFWFISLDGKKYTNCGVVRGDECIRFFKWAGIIKKIAKFELTNGTTYEYKGYAENEIPFEDPITEEICIDNLDTNKDLALSYSEAAAVTDLGYAFQSSSITKFNELQYFVGLQTIGESAFSDCSNLTDITIPNSVTSIGSYAFSRCIDLANITIPNSVTEIGISTFYNCSSLTNITLPNSVATIHNYAFRGCSSLIDITIPNSVTTIGSYAFWECYKLANIYCTSSTPPTGSNNMFESNADGRKIYVPQAAVDAYKTAAYWSSYANDIVGYDF